MKNIYMLILFTALLAGCKEVDYQLFEGESRVQFDKGPDKLTYYSFVYISSAATVDTVPVRVCLIGVPMSEDRKFRFVQIPDTEWEYIRDVHGYVVDSVAVRLFQAESGVHFVMPDDDQFVLKADSVFATVPVVVLRDTSLQSKEYRLRFELVATPDLQLGERAMTQTVISITDMLTPPSVWMEGVKASTLQKSILGKYSRTKHRLMNDAAGLMWDNDQINACLADMSMLTFYIAEFRKALAVYQKENGEPMKDENGEPISFPFNM